MPESDLSLLIEAADAAGRIAMRHWKAGAESWDKPGGAGPVTEADLEVDGMLREMLMAARPGHGWLSEETEDDLSRLDRRRVFIVDPIDGTRSFMEGSSTWAHSLAVARDGQVEAAVIYLPARDKLYAAAAGKGASLNGAAIRSSTREEIAGARVLAARPTVAPANWRDGRVPEFERHHRPSLAYRLSLVAEGRFDAMLTLRRTWEWDIAAGDLILREAGARVSDAEGHALRYNNRDPQVSGLVTGGAAMHAALMERLVRMPA